MKAPQSLTEVMAILRHNKSLLRAKFGVLDIAVFGSYARQTPQMTSDVDLFVDMRPECKTIDNYIERLFSKIRRLKLKTKIVKVLDKINVDNESRK